MQLQLILAGVLIAGYAGYKAFERSGARLSLKLRTPRSRPDKLAYERVTLDATSANLLGFIRNTAQLQRLGFRIVADFVVTGWPDTYLRALIHAEKPVYAMIVERGGPPHLEFLSVCEDLSALTTSGSEEPGDPSRPVSLRLQPLPGLSPDELYMQHLSALDSLRDEGVVVKPTSRVCFFEHHRDLLVVEHELRKAQRALRTETLQAAIDKLPLLPIAVLLKRYGMEDPVSETPVVEPPTPEPPSVSPSPEAPKRWDVGNSLLSRRLAKQETLPAETLVIVPEVLTSEVGLPVQDPGPAVEVASEPRSLLPFEVEPTGDQQEPAAIAVSSKPTCPHCGATLFSSLSSRCSKCKQTLNPA